MDPWVRGCFSAARGWQFWLVSWFFAVPGSVMLILPVLTSLPFQLPSTVTWLARMATREFINAAAEAPVASQLGSSRRLVALVCQRPWVILAGD